MTLEAGALLVPLIASPIPAVIVDFNIGGGTGAWPVEADRSDEKGGSVVLSPLWGALDDLCGAIVTEAGELDDELRRSSRRDLCPIVGSEAPDGGEGSGPRGSADRANDVAPWWESDQAAAGAEAAIVVASSISTSWSSPPSTPSPSSANRASSSPCSPSSL